MVKTPEKHCGWKISNFYCFSLPQKQTFFILRLYENFGQKGVKTGQKKPLGPKLLSIWLESLEKQCMQNFSFLSLLVTKKTDIFNLLFHENLYFRFFDFSKLKKSQVIFQDIKLIFEIWVSNYLSLRWYVVSFFDFGL